MALRDARRASGRLARGGGVASPEEVTLVLTPVVNRKHRAILGTAYEPGLRVSACTHLKVTGLQALLWST